MHIHPCRHVVPAGEIDIRAHPDVDMDVSGMPYFTVPMTNIKGQPMACLQIIVGPGDNTILSLTTLRRSIITNHDQACRTLTNLYNPPSLADVHNFIVVPYSRIPKNLVDRWKSRQRHLRASDTMVDTHSMHSVECSIVVDW